MPDASKRYTPPDRNARAAKRVGREVRTVAARHHERTDGVSIPRAARRRLLFNPRAGR